MRIPHADIAWECIFCHSREPNPAPAHRKKNTSPPRKTHGDARRGCSRPSARPSRVLGSMKRFSILSPSAGCSLLTAKGPACDGCGDYLDRDYAASTLFAGCSCPPPARRPATAFLFRTPASTASPCYACAGLDHDRPGPGTGCGCDENWFKMHAESLQSIGASTSAA